MEKKAHFGRAERLKNALAAAASSPDSLIRLDAVQARVGLSRGTIYARISEKKFPAPVKLSPRCSRWPSGVIDAWVRQQQVA